VFPGNPDPTAALYLAPLAPKSYIWASLQNSSELKWSCSGLVDTFI
jgi:hypothetical protein